MRRGVNPDGYVLILLMGSCVSMSNSKNMNAASRARMRRRLLVSVIFTGHLLLLHPATARSEPIVSVTRSGEAYQIDLRMDVASSRTLAWRVLTDYENLQRFVPGMQSSRIVSGRGEPLLLEQMGESSVLFFKLTTTTVSRISETPESEIRFDQVSGSLKRMQGSWTLVAHDHTVRVGYRAELVPEFAVPPLIGPAVMAQNVKMMAEGVVREIERRKLASTKE